MLGTFVATGIAAVASPVADGAPIEVAVQPGQLLALAAGWERQGLSDRATTTYRALTADANPDIRAEARFRLARMAMAEKRWTDAGVQLRRVLDEKPEAQSVRLALAQVLVELGDAAAALRELRAARAGGLPLDVARMVDRFSEALRVRRPYGASVEVALAPDSNINQATESDTLGTVIGDFTIDPSGRRKSGTGLSLRSSMYARRDLADDVSLLVRLTTSADLYRQSDFNYVAVGVAAGPELRLGAVRLNADVGGSQRWYGGKPYERSLRLGINASYPLDARTVVRGGLSLAKVDNRVNDLQDGTNWGGDLGLERAIDARTGVALSLSAERATLADPGYSTTAWRAQLVGWREIGRATVHASASYGELEADERLALFPDRRKETSWRLGIGATFRHLEVAGFSPLVRYSIERNRSTIEVYDTTRRRAEFGIARAF